MIKQIVALATGALLSFSASAGYVQYELTGLRSTSNWIPDGGRTIIIREEDKSVAFFSIATDRDWFRPDEGDSYHQNWLIETTTSFTGLGPTNMYMRDLQQEEYSKQMWILFSDSDVAGKFDFTMRVLRNPGPQAPFPSLGPWGESTYSGTARQVALDPGLASALNDGNTFGIDYDIPYYDPTQVPEPASLALLAIGALGAFSGSRITRRRKAIAVL
jgi:hypothetical protein